MFKFSSDCVSNGNGIDHKRLSEVASKITTFSTAYDLDASIVTGGFVNEGLHYLQGLGMPTEGIDDRVFASKGIGRVQSAWDEAFRQYGTATGLIVVTHREIDDLGDAERNQPGEGASIKVAHRIIRTAGLIPLYNQNDPIASEDDARNELPKTKLHKDNDLLAQHLGLHLRPNTVFFLTENVWGYEENGEVRRTVSVEEIESGAIKRHVKKGVKESKNGGIISKLEAGAALAKQGIKACIGNYMDDYGKIYTGQSGTQVIQ